MNKFLLSMMCIPAIAHSFAASAQHTFQSALGDPATNSMSQSIPYTNRPNAKKTTAGDSVLRLIGQARLSYDGSGYITTDSAKFNYSNNRGLVLIDKMITEVLFDTGAMYTNTGSAFETSNKTFRTYDTHNNLLSITDQDWIPWLGNWRNSSYALYTYDAADNPISSISQEWDTLASAWVNYTKSISTYTTTNKPASYLGLRWNQTTSAWDNSQRNTNEYDASNFLVRTTYEMWNLGTLAWDSTNRYTYVNDASGNALTTIGESWNSTTALWENSIKNIQTYDASNHLVTRLTQFWDNTSSTWLNMMNDQYSGYIGGMAGSSISQTWNDTAATFINTFKLTYSFNSDSLPTFAYDESWNRITGSWERTAGTNNGARYHYRKDPEVTAIPNVTGNNCKASIYPVPADNSISVDITWDTPQAFTISLLDMAGREIASWDVHECSRYSGVIPLNNFASGNYLLKMEGAKGKLVRRFAIEK